MSRSADSWDEVWDAYEARQPQAEATLHASPPQGGGTWRRVLLPLAAALLFLAGCVAGSAWPVLNLYGRMAGKDMPSVLRLVDLGGARNSVRDALRRHAGLRPGAGDSAVEKLLGAMAEEMADSLTRPGALEGVVLARQEGLLASPHAAAPPLQRLQPAARGLLSFDMGPARGQGGFGLDLAWRGGAWRAVALSLLDPPVARGLEGVRVAREQAALPLMGGRSG
ncbi:hypothetical protein HMPREF9946_02341 [Acetobacteraceae bacterium AT-5844]|nr:hypothetical protein HMPREF9946_02341 [Acetobacteraceae bacterium AT-5844]